MLQVMLDEAVFWNSHFQGEGAGFIYRRHPHFFGHGQYALDTADGNWALTMVESATEAANVRAGLLGSP